MRLEFIQQQPCDIFNMRAQQSVTLSAVAITPFLFGYKKGKRRQIRTECRQHDYE